MNWVYFIMILTIGSFVYWFRGRYLFFIRG
jgi:hypothetical protein